MITPKKIHVIIFIGFLLLVSVISLIVSLIALQSGNDVQSESVQSIKSEADGQSIKSLRDFDRDVDGSGVTEGSSSDVSLVATERSETSPSIKNVSKRFLFAYFNKEDLKGIMVYNRYRRNTCYETDPKVDIASFDTFDTPLLLFDGLKCTGHIMNATGKEERLGRRHHPKGDWKGRIKSFKMVDSSNMFVIDFFSNKFYEGNQTRLYLTKGLCHNLTLDTFVSDSVDGKPVGELSIDGTIVDGDNGNSTHESDAHESNRRESEVPEGSVLIPVTMNSVNTHNNCIYAFDGLDCEGNMTIIQPSSKLHHDMQRIDYPEEGDNDSQGWANRTLSIKSCKGDHNKDIKDHPGEDYGEDW